MEMLILGVLLFGVIGGIIAMLSRLRVPRLGHALLTCPHCQAETRATDPHCQHCGQEMRG